jgi:flagellar hook-associated protein 1 FlgK
MDANVTVTNPTSGDTRDYFAMAGSLKEDLLVFVTGTGSAEVSGQWGSLATVDLRDQLRQNIDVQFAADASTYVLKDVTTNTNIASGTFTAGSTIEHNGWKVSFDGVIKANDKFSIRGNSYQAGDNRNLLNIIDLQGNKDIFSGRGDFTEVYTDVIGNLGNSVVQSAVSRDAQQIIFDQAQAKRDETSAVSLDEEAADLLRFQQAYQASAQIISTANKLFDTILGIG